MTTHLSDLINSFGFELASCLFLSLNIYSLYRDKIVKGMSVLSMAFYNSWAIWNVFLLLFHQSIVVLLHWRCGSDTYNVVDSSGDLVLPQEQDGGVILLW